MITILKVFNKKQSINHMQILYRENMADHVTMYDQVTISSKTMSYL